MAYRIFCMILELRDLYYFTQLKILFVVFVNYLQTLTQGPIIGIYSFETCISGAKFISLFQTLEDRIIYNIPGLMATSGINRPCLVIILTIVNNVYIARKHSRFQTVSVVC